MSDDAGAVVSPTGTTTQADERQGLAFKRVSGPADPAVPYQAPDLPPYFVPREEFFAIKRLLVGHPTAALAPLTLHGVAGSGKSALAAALAHDADVLRAFPDGVLWCSLGPEVDPQHAQVMWGKALGHDLAPLPDALSRAVALRALLRDARALLVVDEVTDIEQLKALSVGGSNCVRLITTEQVEEVSYTFKTRRYAVSRLREEEALRMLIEWAGMLPDIYVPAVKEIIQRVFYLPLPLALIGAQARQGITWLRVLEMLREEQGLLSSLSGDDPAQRQQAIGLVLRLVLARVGEAQQRRALLLGALAGGLGRPFCAATAAACWDVPLDEARAALETLVETSLVQRASPGRYAVHAALHRQLREAADAAALAAAQQRLLAYYVQRVEEPDAEALLDAEIGQVQTVYAASSGDAPAVGLLTDALIAYYERRGLWSYLVQAARRAVDTARAGGDILREDAHLGDLGYAYTMLGLFGRARGCFERSLAISEQVDDLNGAAMALNNIGATYEREGEYLEATDYYERSLALREQLGVREDIAAALINVAGVLYMRERWDEALAAFQRALDMFTVLNDRSGQAQAWLNIGATYERMGRDVDAEQAYQRSLAAYANLGSQAGEAQALNNLGIIFFNQGDTDRALAHFKRSLALKERQGDHAGEASTLNNIALLYEQTGALSLALEHYDRSYQLLDMLEDPRAALVQENIDTLRAKLGRRHAPPPE